MFDIEDTIVGVASAAGRGARGIVRLSGPRVSNCLSVALRRTALPASASPQVTSFEVELPPPLGVVPAELCFWPTNRSYTRQPSAELHMVGAQPILEAAVRHFCRYGARLAEPGEFTLRAFLAGRLDLTQAEAVLGVIDAHDDDQLGVALSQLAGGLATPLSALRTQLIELLAHLEAGLDFVEEDIEFIAKDKLVSQLDAATTSIDDLLTQLDRRGGTAPLAKVVLVGDVNAGKSSLFNVLAGSAQALVSNQGGTTRDYLSHRIDLDGLLVELVDTAGRQQTRHGDCMQNSSQQAATEQASRAALKLICVDVTSMAIGDLSHPSPAWQNQLVVGTKGDLLPNARHPIGCLVTSARTGTGIAELLSAVRAQLADRLAGSTSIVPSTAVRCQESLTMAAQSLRSARDLAVNEIGEELVAAELRLALEELGKVTGTVYTDDILDRVFSRFCIGK